MSSTVPPEDVPPGDVPPGDVAPGDAAPRRLPPIRREILVDADPLTAFEVFTGRISQWWPLEDLSVYGGGGTVGFPGAPEGAALFEDPRFEEHLAFLIRMRDAGYLVAAGYTERRAR